MSKPLGNDAWWDESWNPVGGCRAVSPGCAKCYAPQLAGTYTWPAGEKALHHGLTIRRGTRRIFNGKVSVAPPGHPKATDYVSDHAQPNERTSSPRLLQSSDAFVAEYVLPDYTVDGLLLRRRVYSLTAPTGWGKTAITLRIAAHKGLGLPLHGREMDKGCVLYFAGENHDDVCMRRIKQCEEMGVATEEADVHFMSSTPDLSSDETRRKIDAEIELLSRQIDLVIVDTLVAYLVGDDESDSIQMANLATMFRSYTTLQEK